MEQLVQRPCVWKEVAVFEEQKEGQGGSRVHRSRGTEPENTGLKCQCSSSHEECEEQESG